MLYFKNLMIKLVRMHLILALTLCITFVSCGSDSKKYSNTNNFEQTSAQEVSNDSDKELSIDSPSQPTQDFKPGEMAYLTDNCVGIVDKDDWGQVMDFVKADDMTGIQNLVIAGKATTFAAGKQVKIIKIGFEFVQVRDVDASELLVWVPTNMLTHEDVYGIYTN